MRLSNCTQIPNVSKLRANAALHTVTQREQCHIAWSEEVSHLLIFPSNSCFSIVYVLHVLGDAVIVEQSNQLVGFVMAQLVSLSTTCAHQVTIILYLSQCMEDGGHIPILNESKLRVESLTNGCRGRLRENKTSNKLQLRRARAILVPPKISRHLERCFKNPRASKDSFFRR